MIKYESILKKTRPYTTILADKQAHRLNHCYMIVSEDVLACEALCQLATRVILCKLNDCGECNDCIRVEDGAHSDVVALQEYDTEAVRAFVANSYVKANEGGLKVMLISRFDKIDPKVQNLFLKIFEEPSEQIVFVLGVTQPSMALDTIKSRSKKMFLDELDSKLIEQELLWQGIEPAKIKMAVDCCFGNLTNAVNFATDGQFAEDFDVVVNVLENMQTSKQVVDNLVKMKMKSDDFAKYLDCLEIACKAMMDKICGSGGQGFEQLNALSKVFNRAMLVNICDLVVVCRKKLQSNCKVEAVAESLLLGILEVKYKCR